jgi:CBS domain-containing protein
MKKALKLTSSAALGAGLMYFLDPRQGARRRAKLRDAYTRLSHETRDTIDVTRRDFRNRLQGFKAGVTSLLSRAPIIDDDQLAARIRSRLGRIASHPRAVRVEAHDGHVTLSGPVLASEAQRIFDGVRSVRGVRHVENRMEVHEAAGNISALQGGTVRPGAQWDIKQKRWSPSTRLLMGAGAAGLMAYASGRGLLASTLGALGLGAMSSKLPLGSRQHGQRDRQQRLHFGGGWGSEHRGFRKGDRRRAGRLEIGGLSDRGGYDRAAERSTATVSDIMTPSPATCHKKTTLQEVARLMLQCDCGAIPVVEEGSNRPIGVITDRDITVRAVADGRNPLELTAGDCMTSPVETISCEAGLDECTDKMERSQIRRMLVVDRDQRLCGIVAQADIALHAPEEDTAELVHDVSTPMPVPTI